MDFPNPYFEHAQSLDNQVVHVWLFTVAAYYEIKDVNANGTMQTIISSLLYATSGFCSFIA